jgi:uncharacterized membrane protein YgdD (TMEM256/DUF423 family)
VAAKAFLVAGAVNGALAVIAGAYVAHGAGLAPGSAAFHAAETAARYHMWHALALVLVALLCRNAQAAGAPSHALRVAGGAFLAGIVLFSGGLYLRELCGTVALAVVVPVGGLLFIAGWLALVWHAFRRGA